MRNDRSAFRSVAFRSVAFRSAACLALAFSLAAAGVVGCTGNKGGDVSSTGGGSSRRAFLSMGTAPVGGAFLVVGGAICEVLNLQKGENNWKLQAKGTKGSQANIRGLADGELQLALSNSAIVARGCRSAANSA